MYRKDNKIFYVFFFRAYLKPLLRLLKKQTVTDDVMDSLVKMVVFCLQRDYILSHEKYMEMAVGNAPWPIGVTNAGIHARPARENIFRYGNFTKKINIFISQKVNNINNFQQKCGPRTQR